MKKNDAVYIHIPFCNQICSYCDFCKIFYNEKYITNYLLSLEKEIQNNYKGELISTIYIGGGTPSALSLAELEKLFKILKIFKLNKDYELTIETNVEDISLEKLKLYKKNKVNRLSIGVQTFNKQHLKTLNRFFEGDIFYKIELAKQVGFKNISIDLMYALPSQTKEELLEDLNKIIKLGVTHISTYSLIIEPRTLLYINKTQYTNEDLDYVMYKLIKETLSKHGYNHYEISNFSKPNCESKHNLTYWNNQEYYGFGMGASGYVNGIRYENVKNINKYISGHYIESENEITLEEKLVYEYILGLRKIKGINKNEFYEKFGIKISEQPNVKKLLKEGKLIESDHYIYINEDYIYVSNDILVSLMV